MAERTPPDDTAPEGFDVYQYGRVWYWQSRSVRGHAGEATTHIEALRRAWEDKRTEERS